MLLDALLTICAGALCAAPWLLPVPAWAAAWWIAAIVAVAITASLSPAAFALVVVALIGLVWPLPPGTWLAAAIATAVLCRRRTSHRPASGLVVVLVAAALPGGAAAVVMATAVWLVAWMLAPGPAHPARGLATVSNTVIGHGTFILMCTLLPLVAPVALVAGRRGIAALLRIGSRIVLASPPTFLWTWSGAVAVPGSGAILVGNHTSVLDIMAVLAVPGHDRIIAAKPWVFRTPFLGWSARIGGMMPVETLLAGGTLAADLDLVLFPEGSRSRDCRVRRFHTGAAELSRRTGRAVHLMVQAGAGQALAAGQMWIRPGVHHTELVAGTVAPAEGHRAWMAGLRVAVAHQADAGLDARLGHPLYRLDRWERCAHRGWRAAWAWFQAECRGRWRIAAAMPDVPVSLSGDDGGVVWAALRQRRPMPATTAGPTALVRLAVTDLPVVTDPAVLVVTPRSAAEAWRQVLGRPWYDVPSCDLVVFPPSPHPLPA